MLIQALLAESTPSSTNLVTRLSHQPILNKKWHHSLSYDVRLRMANKLASAVFPSPDPSMRGDRRLRNLVNYAKQMEEETYETAVDKEEYLRLVGEKIEKIKRQLLKMEHYCRVGPPVDCGWVPSQYGGLEVGALLEEYHQQEQGRDEDWIMVNTGC